MTSVGTYSISVLGNTSVGSVNATMNFSIIAMITNNGAPYFTSDLSTITLTVPDTTKYYLPSIEDVDGDDYVI